MPESTGVLGDGSHHAGKGNMALVRRAIRHNWPVSAAIKQRIVDQMETIATAGESERDRIAAAKVLVAADGKNLDRAKILLGIDDGPEINVQVNNVVTVAAIAERDDAELERFIHATAGVGGNGKAATNGHTVPGGVLSALANGTAVPVSTNGKH